MSDNATLTIENFECRIGLAGTINPGVVRDAVERVARDDLATALDRLELPEAGDAVYRLRHLQLELWTAVEAEPRQALAARWGRALGVALQRALQGDDPAQVVRFESPQAFTLHFLRDLVDGRAWHLWYYEEFAVLRLLPDERAALELLIHRPDWLLALLRELMGSGHGDRLLARWTAADLARLWAALGLRPAPATAHGLATVAPAWLRAGSQVALNGGTDEDARARDALRLWLAAPPHNVATMNAARLLIDVAALLRLTPAARGLLLMQSEFYPDLLAQIQSYNGLARLQGLTESAPGRAVLARAAEIVVRRESTGSGDARMLSSPAGSVFLLLGPLRELDLWQKWRDRDGEAAARRYLFIVALKALGDRRSLLFRDDRMLAAFAGLEEPPLATSGARPYAWLTPALEEALAAATALALRDFAALLPGFAGSSPAFLADKFLAHPATLLRGPDLWRVRLDGGPLRMVLRMAALPDRLSLPWLPLPLTCTVAEEVEP
jgi:hypothetical protein